MVKKILLLILLSSCASGPTDKVLVRSDDLSERPAWAKFSETAFVKEGRLFVVSHSETDVEAKISAVARIADNNARFEISRIITDDLSFIFQNMEEGINDNEGLTRFYASEISKHVSHGIRQEKRYWEKVESFDSEGEKKLKLRFYSLASIKESDLKKAIKDSLDNGNKLDPRIKEKVNSHLFREIEKLGQN